MVSRGSNARLAKANRGAAAPRTNHGVNGFVLRHTETLPALCHKIIHETHKSRSTARPLCRPLQYTPSPLLHLFSPRPSSEEKLFPRYSPTCIIVCRISLRAAAPPSPSTPPLEANQLASIGHILWGD